MKPKTLASRTALTLVLGLALGGCRGNDPTKSDGLIKKDTGGGGGEKGPGAETTIKDIVTRKTPDGASIVLRDVIVSAVDGYGQYTGDVYVQDAKGGPSSGLYLYRPQRVDAGGQITDLKPGDHVKVEGVVKWYGGSATSPFGKDAKHPNKKNVVELDQGCQVSKLASGPPPAPAVVTLKELTEDPTAEGWEWVLVTVKDLPVTTLPDAKYNEFEVGGLLGVTSDLYLHSPKVGECVSVTGVAKYFYIYKVMPRDATDFGPGAGCPQIKTVTIKDIQDETSANHPAANSTVTTTGVITAVDSTLSGTPAMYNGFWIQDPAGGARSGIYVFYSWADTDTLKPKLGELIEITAKYSEFKSSTATKPDTLSELDPVTWTVKGAGTIPAPAVVPAADIATGGAKVKDWEGVLVKVENVAVGDPVLTTGTTKKQVGFKLATSLLNVENDLFDFLSPTMPPLGTPYKSITGVAHYSFDNNKILPRSAADLVK